MRAEVRAFIREVVIPTEALEGEPGLLAELHAVARERGLFAPHVARRWGGLGLDTRAQAVVFEEAGYSLLGPAALNRAAPDEVNMALLEKVASEQQKERYLRPVAAGELRCSSR